MSACSPKKTDESVMLNAKACLPMQIHIMHNIKVAFDATQCCFENIVSKCFR